MLAVALVATEAHGSMMDRQQQRQRVSARPGNVREYGQQPPAFVAETEELGNREMSLEEMMGRMAVQQPVQQPVQQVQQPVQQAQQRHPDAENMDLAGSQIRRGLTEPQAPNRQPFGEMLMQTGPQRKPSAQRPSRSLTENEQMRTQELERQMQKLRADREETISSQSELERSIQDSEEDLKDAQDAVKRTKSRINYAKSDSENYRRESEIHSYLAEQNKTLAERRQNVQSVKSRLARTKALLNQKIGHGHRLNKQAAKIMSKKNDIVTNGLSSSDNLSIKLRNLKRADGNLSLNEQFEAAAREEAQSIVAKEYQVKEAAKRAESEKIKSTGIFAQRPVTPSGFFSQRPHQVQRIQQQQQDQENGENQPRSFNQQ